MNSNYVTANRFYVEMEGAPIAASFTECSNFSVKIKYEPIKQGGVNDGQRIVLGQPEFSEITLKRGVTDSTLFWNWMNMTMGPGKLRRNVNIYVYNQAGEIMQCWSLIRAVPVGWSAPALQAEAKAVAIEELTLAYEKLNVESKGYGLPVFDEAGR